MGVTIKITDNTGKVKIDFEAAVRKALTTCGLQAQDFAKETLSYDTNHGGKVHVDTGLLRNSIAYALGGEGAHPESYSADKGDGHGSYSGTAPENEDGIYKVYLGTNVEYAKYVEYGTYRSQAYPYIKPAIADHSATYAGIIKNELGGVG